MNTTSSSRPICDTWLSALLDGFAIVNGDIDRLVGSLQLSSQKVERGDVFMALPGVTADGRDYIDSAIVNQASAIIFEKLGSERKDDVVEGIPLIGIENLKSKVGIIASRNYDNPSRQLNVIGVTGTNGKTTSAYLVAQALNGCAQLCAYSGTIGAGLVGELKKSELTTVDAISLQAQLANFVEQGANALAIETSSHGLDQGRANGVEFSIGVFTNLTQDHLDYHQSMEKYAEAKKKLFEFESLRHAVINVDDSFGRELAEFCKRDRPDIQCITYGMQSGVLKPDDLVVNDQGLSFSIILNGERVQIGSRLLGEINVLNLLAAIGVLLACGIDSKSVASVMPSLSAPPGRMEAFRGALTQPMVVVDYAHSPDALERALRSLKSLSQGRVFVVFGCGGDRDQGKRPQMGAVAELLADVVIITDDNSRTEPAEEIVQQIQSGMNHPARVIHDRKQAVSEAIRSATAEDIILVAGKGHEDTQSVSGHRIPLSDREFVVELLEEMQ